jgi:hypothetical protein
MNASPVPATAKPKPVSTPAEAQALASHLDEVMDALLQVVEHETELVRAGRITEAGRLETSKNDLARLYVADTLALNASVKYFQAQQPALLKHLRQGYDNFHALLQLNLTVLATAHAVSEGLIRGVSAEVARKSQPQVYGASGRHAAPRSGASAPVAIAKSL